MIFDLGRNLDLIDVTTFGDSEEASRREVDAVQPTTEPPVPGQRLITLDDCD